MFASEGSNHADELPEFGLKINKRLLYINTANTPYCTGALSHLLKCEFTVITQMAQEGFSSCFCFHR